MTDFQLNRTVVGSCVPGMDEIPEALFHAIITSPPYWAQRDYKTPPEEWPEIEYTMHGGLFPVKVPEWKGQLGLEPDPYMFIGHMVHLFRKAWRILRDDGTLWVNIADSYAAATKKRTHVRYNGPEQEHRQPRKDVPGLKRKDLVGIPWLLAFALRDDGWYWRQDIVWSKKSAMPESVKDRCTRSHEYILLFSKSRFYYFDEFSIMTESKHDFSKYPYARAIDASPSDSRKGSGQEIRKEKMKGYAHRGENADANLNGHRNGDFDVNGQLIGGGKAKKRSVWNVGTQPTKEAHFACLSADTECLTINGWKHYWEIKLYEKIASYDTETKTIKWAPLTDLKEYKIDQEIIKVGNRDLDILMTPNHRNVVLKANGEEKIVLAEDLAFSDKIRVSADFEITSHNSLGVSIAELIGWIISEGNYRPDGAIYIYQNEGNKADRIRQLLSPFSTNETRRNNNQVEWYIPVFVSKMFRAICPHKKLTRELVMLPIEEAKALFNGLMDGDGSYRSDGRCQFIQKDKKTVDWFSILAMRLGYHSCTSKRKGLDTYDVFLTKKTHIGIRGTNGKGTSVRKEYYNGHVWCPKTKYGTWVARRNGRVFITGNTYPEELIVPAVKAGIPELCCADCGAPYKRQVSKELIPTAKAAKTAVIDDRDHAADGNDRGSNMQKDGHISGHINRMIHLGWKSTCKCKTKDTVPGRGYDPFSGSGTTRIVCGKENRHFFGHELSAEYNKIEEKRALEQLGLFK